MILYFVVVCPFFSACGGCEMLRAPPKTNRGPTDNHARNTTIRPSLGYFRPYTHRRRARGDELHCSLAMHYIIFLSPFPPQSNKQSRGGRRRAYIQSPRRNTQNGSWPCKIAARSSCSPGGSSCVRPSYLPAKPTCVLITFCFRLRSHGDVGWLF